MRAKKKRAKSLRTERGITYDQRDLVINVTGKVVRIDVFSSITRVLILLSSIYLLWTVLPHQWVEPGGYVFDPVVTVVFSAIVGGAIAKVLSLPPLVGVLWSSLLWGNLPGGLTKGTLLQVKGAMRNFGLSIVLLRAGLSFNIKLVRPFLAAAVLTIIVPCIVESFVAGMIASATFGVDFLPGLMIGCVQGPASAAAIVPPVLKVQADGYSTKGGPGVLLSSTAAMDSVVGVFMISLVSGLLVEPHTSFGLSLGLAPVQIIVGFLIGGISGYLIVFIVGKMYEKIEVSKSKARAAGDKKKLAKVSGTEYLAKLKSKTLWLTLTLGVSIVFEGKAAHFPGAGSIACTVMGATMAHLWIKDGDHDLEARKKALYYDLGFLWDYAAMPMLFSMAGSNVNALEVFSGAFLGPAFACLAVGLVVRACLVFLFSVKAGFNAKERVYAAFGSLGKATVQGAMGSVVFDAANELVKSSPPTGEEHDYALTMVTLGQTVKTHAVFCILVCGTIAPLFLSLAAPRLLTKDDDDSADPHAVPPLTHVHLETKCVPPTSITPQDLCAQEMNAYSPPVSLVPLPAAGRNESGDVHP